MKIPAGDARQSSLSSPAHASPVSLTVLINLVVIVSAEAAVTSVL